MNSFSKRLLVVYLLLSLSVTLFACGFSSGGSGAGSEDAVKPKEDETPASYTVSFVTEYGEVNDFSGTSLETPEIKNSTAPNHLMVSGWYESSDYAGTAVAFPYAPKADCTLYAKWDRKSNFFSVTYVLNGGVNAASNPDYHVSFVTTLAEPTYYVDNTYHAFLGWYDNENFEGDAVTALPPVDCTLYAKWKEPADVGYTTVEEGGKTYVLLGEYPQSVASATVCAALASGIGDGSILSDEDGYYALDGKRYARRTASSTLGADSESRVFSDGRHIDVGAEYFFEVEPIKWQIEYADTERGTATLMSKYVIDNLVYESGRMARGWSESELRTWLAGDFSDLAFSVPNLAFMQTVTNSNTQNSCYHELSVGNSRLESTTDTVWLAGSKELTYESRGYVTSDSYDEARCGIATDYVRATLLDGEYVGTDCFADWWTRSIGGTSTPGYQVYVNSDGLLLTAPTGEYAFSGVRPSVQILR